MEQCLAKFIDLVFGFRNIYVLRVFKFRLQRFQLGNQSFKIVFLCDSRLLYQYKVGLLLVVETVYCTSKVLAFVFTSAFRTDVAELKIVHPCVFHSKAFKQLLLVFNPFLCVFYLFSKDFPSAYILLVGPLDVFQLFIRGTNLCLSFRLMLVACLLHLALLVVDGSFLLLSLVDEFGVVQRQRIAP